MRKRQRQAPKLFALMGGAGLALGICVSSAHAAPPIPPFTNANYAERYACNLTSFDSTTVPPEFFSAIIKINPDGAGGYTGTGVLKAAATAINGVDFDDTLPPRENFCFYTQDNAGSSYSIGAGGIGTEVLSWIAVAGNNASCPGDFVMSNTIVLKAGAMTSDNLATGTQTTSNNLMNDGVAGQGYCSK
jgi:hypothetical protein